MAPEINNRHYHDPLTTTATDSPRRRLARPLGAAAAVLFLAAIIGGCGLSFSGPPATPSQVVATTDRTDLIELSWGEATGADVYYVYRSLSPGGSTGTSGPYGPVPYRTVTQTILLDVETDPTNYYYAVSAGKLSTNVESEPSAEVMGTRLAEEIGWRAQATVFGAPGTVRLTVDRTTSTVQAYVLTVGDASGATATVRQIESDGTLTSIGGPSEATDGTDTRVADIAAAGSVYAALVAEDPDVILERDRIFLYRYDTDLEEWLFLEGPLFDYAHPSAPFVTMVAIGADDLLISYRDQDGGMAVYRYDGTLDTGLTPPAATDDTVDAGDPSIGQIDAAAVPGGAVLLYELEDDTSATLGDTMSLAISVWNGSDWPAGTTIYDGSTGNVATGAMAIAIDPAVAIPADGAAIVYHDGSIIRIVDKDTTLIADSATAFSGVADPDETWVGAAAGSGVISLFYRDLAEDAGVVAQFDTESSLWSVFSPPDFTQTTPSQLSMAAGGGKWFAAFDDGGITRVRTHQ